MDQLSPQFIKTEAVDPIDSFISFHVKNVLRTTPFKKLKEVYCKRNRLKIHATKFLFDGLNVMDNDTPDSLEMEEGDSIHVIFAPAIRNVITNSDQLLSQFIKTEEPTGSANSFFSIMIYYDYDYKNDSIKRKETTYIVERAKPLKKLMESHSEINGLSPATLRFLFDGCRIHYDDTPDFLEMEDDDIIDYVPERIVC
ncbi:hypothetical protein GLOIN_2v1868195 [Rhizophagus irregularis DAOM 181602=DAOM 197198]|uniref:Ubiquitin-like domain-containing protein n=1 Tax=Rhizophagus irregularis (strain DAOM 181602 / DAOM 197198 / MUCL 43194) TaxID=747089 RepID=A0A2P4QUR9_RHIID|nr:hypothetical protein GLOIN_2v1868195 [Rhizophagus irregularis DAOM 181602=DAOM 197198]POG81403.1 hypothetical protein GLOIN_2v1868195 [Rhizophagus irregularis DAOM 181602=DAOM 197198]|eukprot:XP_025188269.1 hypothetical protein GLOIN_2v1868195 [Rhizophagus irregularis DAOM 181602=DAOM 197198]